jgi:exosortase E/protease (VPEID-CTERM system)
MMADPPANEAWRSHFRIGFLARLGLLATLLLAEKLILEALVDERRAQAARGIGRFVRDAQHWGLRYLVTFFAAALVLVFIRAQDSSQSLETTQRLPRPRISWFLVHAFFVAGLAPLSYLLYRGDVTSLGFAAVSVIWVLACIAAVLAASVGLIPAAIWIRGIRYLGRGWIYAAAMALLGTSAWSGSESLWSSTTTITFQLVKTVLAPFIPHLITDPVGHVIGTNHFAVEISEVCSGLEGLGLMLAFSGVWLIYFRREYIFPRALILIPICLLAMFGLNVMRIAALFLIGNSGYPEVALYGFHSQAGWIAFNIVAGALVYFSRQNHWLNRAAGAPVVGTTGYNPTALYLMPLLGTLAAGVLSHAMSGKFEILYPLRFIAGVAIIALYRHRLWQLDWRSGWRGPIVGVAVFLIWMASARALLPVSGMPEALISLSPPARVIWIASRLLASTLTVPIAEELAYRGYLMRRLMRSDFESVPFTAVRGLALAVSSVAFGMAHGALWLPGCVAGLIYGKTVIRSGRLGEALAAHATTNLLVAGAVLYGNQWQLW